jgi:bacterioferritin-associated ferredoxin
VYNSGLSRAFVKEPEAAEPRCPAPNGCGGLGRPVSRATLEAHAPPEACRALSEGPFYCPAPGCRVAYFDAWGAIVTADRITGTAYPKDPGGPICPCFGVTAAEIEADARAGRKDRVRDLLARAEGPEAHCERCAPDGRSCATEVRRLFSDTRARFP